MEDIREKRKSFISFLDENDRRVDGYFFYKIENGLCLIESTPNLIKVPVSRLLKIKDKLGDFRC